MFDFKKIFFKLPLSQKIIFTKQLAMMVRSGMSEVDSIRMIKRQVKSRSFKKILEILSQNLENGQLLSSGLEKFKNVFGDLFINIVKIGEASGTLSENLDYLSSELQKRQILSQKIRSALIYPVIILIATVGITGILVFFVMPKIIPVFSSLNVPLPLTTRFVIAVSNFMINYIGWIALGILIAAILFSLLLKFPKIKFLNHRLMIGLPVVGQIVTNTNVANMTRTLGILLKSGVKIVDALGITANTLNNLVYREEVLKSAEQVKKGDVIYSHLNQMPKLFPPLVGQMIEVGETTGNLDSNLFYLAEFYEDAVDQATKNLSSVLEPALLLIMGGVVGFVAISIITPIYAVTQNIGFR